MINVILCDDNKKDCLRILKVVEEFMNCKKIEYDKYVFNDYNNKFYRVVEEKLPSKIYLLDIETPSASGIDIARIIRKKDVDSVIIFLIAYKELGNTLL